MTVTPAAIEDAARRIAPYVRRTPVMDVAAPRVLRPVALKLELLQHTGSFKARGAFNNLIGATPGPGGVAAASGGNHGAAVAYAAQTLGFPAHIFVPEIASPAKVKRIASYGAQVHQQGAAYAEALALCERHIVRSGAIGVHAYDSTATLAGQGTLALELEEQSPDIDTLLVAVGGGGLIGGIAAWYRGLVKVVGVEPRSCACLHAALAAGHPVDVVPSGIAADSLGSRAAGELMFPLAQRFVADVALVSDDDIRAAQRWLWNNVQLVTEPGGAAAFAALLSGAYLPHEEERVGVVVCGANTMLDSFAKLFA